MGHITSLKFITYDSQSGPLTIFRGNHEGKPIVFLLDDFPMWTIIH